MSSNLKNDYAQTMIRDDFERSLVEYWDTKQDDAINLLLGAEDGLYHHHFGLGDFDRTLEHAPPDEREARVLEEMHRLENAQARALVEALGDVRPEHRVLDAGSGRGGTSFVAYDRYGCYVDGVNFSSYQVDYANRLAASRGCADKVRFHLRNMVDTGFPDNYFNFIFTNETTPYADLTELFTELSRVLAPGGRYVGATWCRNDAVAQQSPEVLEIDAHYICRTHRRSTYFRRLAEHNLVPRTVIDHTLAATPYFEVRLLTRLRTGSEQPYLDCYRKKLMDYIFFVVERV
ncbi:MAG: geranyl diphosphate 2-C-methyltransferase [Mycobacteriales bacterium]|jgi:geranyl diphosphate 2-C-methyltransferase